MHVVLKPDVFYGGNKILIQILCCVGNDSELKSLRVRRREKKGEGIGREGNRPPSLFLA